MKNKSKKFLKKKFTNKTTGVLAAILAVNSIGTVVAASLTSKASKANGEAITNAKARDIISIDGVGINLDQELNDNGDGTYTLTINSASNLKYEDLSVKMTKVQNGYYRAEQSGSYMLEIFGGNGGEGQNTTYSKGGNGGNGGHVYAVAELNAGDILYYTIGGNGQKTLSNDTGGGANGDGGDHGDSGSYYVGGGGGYTALYKFGVNDASKNAQYFLDTYTNADGSLNKTLFDDADRTSKYVMIAGGGGGGGAGNAFSLVDKAVRTPDGGAGGSFASTKAHLDSSYTVPGYFYAGSNGFSSGKSESYIGWGGTEKPGKVNETWLTFFDGKQPNGWVGTENPILPGGSGGAGNLRGGAGGAGFAGGSGGIMTGLLVGTNVGGGGGGSSFIADSLYAPSEEQQGYVSNINDSDTGGSVYITYMPEQDNYEYLNDLQMKGEISKYFDIIADGTYCYDSNGTNLPVDISGNVITVDNVKASPTTPSGQGQSTSLKVHLKPINGFMGGNDVPVVKENSFVFNYVKQSVPGTVNLVLDDTCTFVNVPYAFELKTQSLTKSASQDTHEATVTMSELFEDKKYNQDKSAHPVNYEFIDSISDYVIYYQGTGHSKTETVTITEDSTFTVNFTVNPKAGSKAIVGPKLEKKTYSGTAKVTLIEFKKNNLNGNEMVYLKTLNYDSSKDQYIFDLNVSTSGEYEHYIEPLGQSLRQVYPNASTDHEYETGTYNVEYDGIYYLQAWGGNGGLGGTGSNGNNDGANGGTGGNIETWVYLTAGTEIQWTVGKNGNKGKKADSWLTVPGHAGIGGALSSFTINGNVIIAAAGGGGGGGFWQWHDYTAGANVNNANVITTYNHDSIHGQSLFGVNVESEVGQSAGTNYKYANIADYQPEDKKPRNLDDLIAAKKGTFSRTNQNGGAVYITPIGQAYVVDTYDDYYVEPTFTSNFNIVSKTVVGGTYEESGNNLIHIMPTKQIDEANNKVTINFTARYVLEPAETCLGGYDIKLLNALTLGQVDCDGNVNNDSFAIPEQNATDYANVRILPSLLSNFNLDTHDLNYISGREALDPASLYSASTSYVPEGQFKIKEAKDSESIVESGSPKPIKPNQTTDYSITYGIYCEKPAEPKAVVGPELNPLVLTQNARVTVYNEVKYELTNVTVDAPVTKIDGEDVYTFTPGKDYEATFTPTVGMELLDTITIKVDGQPFTKYTYEDKNLEEKELVIKAADIKNASTISISTSAKERTFKLHYLVSLDASGVNTRDHVVDVKAGLNGGDFETVLNNLLGQYPLPGEEIPTYTGYTYVIEYPDGEKLTTMPAYDVWINGTYHPNPHSLTINYVDTEGNVIAPQYVDDSTTCYNKKDIDQLTPAVDHYAPYQVRVGSLSGDLTTYNPARIQFQMPDNDVVLYVIYKSTESSVVVNFQCKDSGVKLPEAIAQSGDVGTHYEIQIPKVDGYVADVEKIEGDYTSEGRYEVVTYSPVAYTISFHSNIPDASPEDEFADRNVFYGHEIGYTGESYEASIFTPLPTPVRVGYNFKGWFLNGFVVTGLSVYDIAGNGTLEAMWEKQVITVTEENCNVTFNPEVLEYNGEQQFPEVIVTVDGATLTEGVDYDITYPLDSEESGFYDIIIRFKGNYEGEIIESYYIAPKDIPASDIHIDDISHETYTYTGEEIKPTPKVFDDEKELTYGTDYYYEYVNNINKGEAEVIIKFIGNYANTPDQVVPFTISAKDATEDGQINVSGIDEEYTYTGSPITPEPVVKYTNAEGYTITLVKGTDYIVIQGENLDVGEGSVTIKFINNYSATPDKVVTFDITPIETDLTKVTVEGIPSEGYVYDGTAKEPKPEVKYDGVLLVEGVDYVLTYDDNVHVNSDDNTPTVHITFIGNYDGVKDVEFEITPKVVTDPTEELDIQPTSSPDNPIIVLDTNPKQDIPVTIYDGENELIEGQDFDIIDNGDGTGQIVFKGDYEGSNPVDIYYEKTSPTVTNVSEKYEYTGQPLEPKPVIIFNGVELVEGEDYMVTYEGNDKVGDAKIIITYIKDPYNTLINNPVEIPFEIIPQTVDPSKLDVEEILPVTYDGTSHKPTPIVTYNGVVLTAGVDFDYSYGENIHAGLGAGRVTITFKDGFQSVKPVNVYFDIIGKKIDDPLDPETGLDIEPLPTEDEPWVIPNNGHDPVDFPPVTIIDPVTGEELRNPEDFHIEDNGDGTGQIVFDGDYEGTPDVPIFYETQDPEITSTIDDQPYTGGPVEPKVDVEFDGKPLVEGEDYVLEYLNNDEVGTGTVVVKFIGDYEGCPDKTLDFEIVQTSVDPSKVTYDPIPDEEFNGLQHTPYVVVYYDGVELTINKDYTLTYGENVHAGEDAGIVYITFKGGFTAEDSFEVTFTITPKALDPENITVLPEPENPGEPIKVPANGTDPFHPDIEVIDDETGEPLEEGVDYILNVDEEEGTITIEFINDYEGNDPIVEEYEKVPGDISDVVEIEEIPEQEYDPDGNEPKPEVSVDGNPLEEGKDFEYIYEEDEEGNKEVIIHFINDYSETSDIEIPYEVVSRNIENPEITFVTGPVVYNGEEVKPSVLVKDGDRLLTEGVDYVVHYVNNNAPGTGEAIITFIGNYAATNNQDTEFEIKAGMLDNSKTTANGSSTVIVANAEGFNSDISLYAKLVETVPEEVKNQASLGGRFYGTYGCYDIKLFDKDGNEIQPSDMKEGTVLTLMIELPSELRGKDVKIVHYHSADDISLIVRGDKAAIGTYIITEEGYLVTQINKFSNFSLIYEETCLAHWFLITAAVLDILLIAAIIISGKKQSKAVGIAATVGLAVLSGVGAIFAHCTICWVALGINGALILFNILFFAMWKGKDEPAQPVQQVIYQQVAAPIAPAPVQPAPAPVAPQLSLSQSIAKAAVINNDSLFVTKQIVAQYLSDNYSENVSLNRKPNYTSTNLPLADTHYVQVSEERKLCFIYVYELNDNKSFFIVRTSKDIYEAIKAKHPVTELSAFPKAQDELMWYSVMFDSSYKTLNDVYEVIDMVLKGFMVDKKAPVVEELSLHDQMEKAHLVHSDLKVNKEMVANYLVSAYKDSAIVNRKPNYTKTGLPLADTHYVSLGEDKKACFMYVYELNDGASFCIVKTSEEIFKAIREKHASASASLFPQTKDGGKWYSVMFDSSFASEDDVHELIDMVINGFEAKPVEVKPEPAPVVPEPVVEDEEGGINYMYKFSFSARLIRAGAERQDFYNEIKNEYLSYKKVNSKISWGHELFKLGRIKLGQMKVKGKTLCVYLPLDPSKYDKDRLWFKETGDEEFPMMMQVKSDRAVKYVKELIADVMANNNIPHMDNYEPVDYRLPEMTIEEMLTSDPVLAKLIDGAVMPKIEMKPEPAPVVEEKPEITEPAYGDEDEDAKINYMYKFSFSARLIRAGMDRQDFYNDIKNEYLSYKKVNSKISWGHELFKLGRIKLGQLKVKGKTLCLYLPLDPDKYDKDRLFYKDMRVPGKEVGFPMMLQVKSDRGVKYAKELITEVMALNEIPHNDNYEPTNYRLRNMSIEQMLNSNPPLAKLSDGSLSSPAPKAAKVEKEVPAPVVPEPVVEEEDGGINYMYKFSFSARLIRAGMDRQEFYNELKNEILSFKKAASKISWGHELFKLGRIKLAQMKVKGKTLCVYLPLDPAKYDKDRLFFKETGNEEFPMMMQVKSDRGVKYVKELLADVMSNNGLARNDNYIAQDYKLPEMSIEEMLKAEPPLAKANDSKVSFGK